MIKATKCKGATYRNANNAKNGTGTVHVYSNNVHALKILASKQLHLNLTNNAEVGLVW
jgi:hypothetical protein